MEWKVASIFQSDGPFSSLGLPAGDTNHISDDCLRNLEDILSKLCSEDRTLRTFRRALGFFQVIKKELLPLLIFVKNDHNITAATIRVLVNLTVPVECLLPIDVMSKTEVGLQTISELNTILIDAQEAFVDSRTTKAVLEYIKQLLEKDVNSLTVFECESVNNCLLLIRNILHAPEPKTSKANAPHNLNNNINNNMQNQLIWNLFSQGIDKILINLMTCSQKSYWGVTMVQLIALMYKDQHVSTMQKLLNLWFEASLSESSEDNESNTSPPDQGSGNSSPMLTSDPTSDSSDTGCSSKDNRMLALGVSMMDIDDTTSKQHLSRHHNHTEPRKSGGKTNCDGRRMCPAASSSSRRGSACKSYSSKSDVDSGISLTSQKSDMETKQHHPRHSTGASILEPKPPQARQPEQRGGEKRGYPSSSETSDCGYATQKVMSTSTSGNEDITRHNNRNMKHVHQKPHTMQKTRYVVKQNPMLQDQKECRKRKLAKRTRTTNFSVNMKALMHYTPSDEDISNLLKEFTVEFLLKGYGSLVQELHRQLMDGDKTTQIDTSHFFWLVTYFLKFAAQLELELDIIKSVLSFEILSYLTYEGVNLFEQLELASRQERIGLTPYLRRIHLVVTAIREILQAIETYKKITHLSCEDRKHLLQLQLQIGSTEDLRCLFVLLLQQYNPICQSKQYLQDLIITNHMFLLCLDNISKIPEFNGNSNPFQHIKQFATVEVMSQYGLLLEDFRDNGEFINNCIFTMMHHISGDLEEPSVLFQPSILKTFSEIWETDFEICDDWSDLIEYVMHKFMNILRPNPLLPQVAASVQVAEPKTAALHLPATSKGHEFGWPKEGCGNLYWYYVQSAKSPDPVGLVKDLYAENGITNITRIQIIEQLLTQDVIDRGQYDDLMRIEAVKSSDQAKLNMMNDEGVTPMTIDEQIEKSPTSTSENVLHSHLKLRESANDTISTLRDHLVKENKGPMLKWLQNVLLEACFVKLNSKFGVDLTQSHVVMEPVPLHYTLLKQSIPIVPWNSDQKNILSYQPFILLLHKLGFHLPADSGKIFVRIPHFWTADVLIAVAEKLGPITTGCFKFDASSINIKREVNKETHVMNSASKHTSEFAVHCANRSLPIIRFDPLPNSTPTALQIAMDTELSNATQDEIPSGPVISISLRATVKQEKDDDDEEEEEEEEGEEEETTKPSAAGDEGVDGVPDATDRLNTRSNESVASDLSHNMCISDEETGVTYW